MDIFYDELISNLLFAPDYLPDVVLWYKNQPKMDGHISWESARKILTVLSYPCWQKFLQAYVRPCELTSEDLVAAEYKLLTETGLARIESVKILGTAGKGYNLYMTDDTRELMSSHDPFLLDQEKRRRSLIHLFAAAAVNAYGVIGKKAFIDIFNGYRKTPAGEDFGGQQGSFEPLSPDELEEALLPYTELHVDVLLSGDYLMSRLIDSLPQFLSTVFPGEYYPFGRDAFLKYSDPEYFEMTPEIANFLWLMDEYFPDMPEGEKGLIQLLFSPSYLSDWSQMIEVELCPMLKDLPGEEQGKMAEAFIEAKRSARSWQYKGFSEETILKGENFGEDVREFMRALEEC